MRLIPGTIYVTEETPDRILVRAITYEYGPLEITL